MEKHEGKRMARVATRSRLIAGATALVGAIALAAPAVAGAASSAKSITIRQNRSMIVDVSTLDSSTYSTVSWADVSWSDAL